MTRRLPASKAAAAAGLLAVLILGACSPVPRSTMAALHAFDLSTVVASDVRIAVRSPDALVLDGGAPTLTVTVSANGAAATERRYVMSEIVTPPSLSAEARPGMVVQTFALDTRSSGELDAYLAELRRTAAPGQRSLSIGLAIEGCRTDGPDGRLAVTTYVQLTPGGPFMVLTRERDLAAIMAMAGATTEIRTC